MRRVGQREAFFERYARGSRATWEGTAPGLAIVHDIAGLHGAVVTISDGELGGACLAIEFPTPQGALSGAGRTGTRRQALHT